ncbi:hypothetical protein SAMN05216256_10175 [Halopseudomonas pachastrellae]|uniref:hypothetical protein n=1 Tax=Halopseudomonas pachastrellae TaxID=254161 RepID=UPI0008F08CB3|nr:hypothetical protein [Halopseudomonas pachastrellae]SFL70705.1 hypothetical protein SAMN05216256_10175 [Halopseudomonas pachastrellae]
MTTQLTARHIAGRNGQPLAVVNGLPGLDARMTPTQLRQLARQANQIAIDSESGVRGMRRYPETEEQSNEN